MTRLLDTQATPHAFAAIRAEKGPAIRVVYCLECDISSVVRWDRKRKRFTIRGDRAKD